MIYLVIHKFEISKTAGELGRLYEDISLGNDCDNLVVELQRKELNILREFNSFCNKNNLNYSMIGGTLIGAVRHKGFIPWDDDIDVGMPRPDYERLIRIADKFPAGFKISTHGRDKGYIYPYAKCYDENTLFTESFVKPFTRGVWIDIFPLDGTFENKTLRNLHCYAIKFMRVILVCKVGAYFPNESLSRRIVRNLFKLISVFFSKEVLFSVIDKLASFRDYKNSPYAGNFLGRWGIKETQPREVFDNRVLMDFSGEEAYGLEKYDSYLGSVYGDYMKLPPEESRKSDHHFSEIDLDRPWNQGRN